MAWAAGARPTDHGAAVHAGLLHALLCARLVIEELGRQIRTVRPDQRVQFWINAESLELVGIPKRFEDLSPKLRLQVYFARGTISERDSDPISFDVPRFE